MGYYCSYKILSPYKLHHYLYYFVTKTSDGMGRDKGGRYTRRPVECDSVVDNLAVSLLRVCINVGCRCCSWSAERGELTFPCTRSRLRVWSPETGSAVPSRVSLLILHTQAESGAYSRDSSRFPSRRPFIYLNRHTPSGLSRVYQVTQMRTDGVHRRESAGTGPVNLKVVPVTGAIFTGITMDYDQLMCASLFPHPLY